MAASIRTRAFAFRIHHVQYFSVRREIKGRRIPADRNVFENLHGGCIDNSHGIYSRLCNIGEPAAYGYAAGHHAPQRPPRGVVKARVLEWRQARLRQHLLSVCADFDHGILVSERDKHGIARQRQLLWGPRRQQCLPLLP